MERSRSWQYFDLNYNDTNQNTKFYTELYSRLIIKLIEEARKNTQKNICVNLHSFGAPDIFEGFIKKVEQYAELKLMLDSEGPETFFNLTQADFLVHAHGSMSWLASFFCKGKSFVRFPFRHEPSPSTYYFDDDLTFFKIRHKYLTELYEQKINNE